MLGRHDGNIEIGAQLDVVVDVVTGQGIFVPVVVEVLDCLADSERLRVVVCPDRVQHEPIFIADGGPDRTADLDVLFDVDGRWVDLVRRPSGGLNSHRLRRVLFCRAEARGTGVGRDVVAV